MFLENTLNFDKQTGWIEVVCGSMFSGKTEELIRRIKRAQFAGLKPIIFKPKVDTRDGEKKSFHMITPSYPAKWCHKQMKFTRWLMAVK